MVHDKKYCTKCGRELVYKRIFDNFDSDSGKKLFEVRAICPLMDSKSLFVRIFVGSRHDSEYIDTITDEEYQELVKSD